MIKKFILCTALIALISGCGDNKKTEEEKFLQGFLQGLNAISPSSVYEHYIKNIEGYYE